MNAGKNSRRGCCPMTADGVHEAAAFPSGKPLGLFDLSFEHGFKLLQILQPHTYPADLAVTHDN